MKEILSKKNKKDAREYIKYTIELMRENTIIIALEVLKTYTYSSKNIIM